MSKGEETRQRIIASAAPLFNQHGFEGCSMQDVMTVTSLEKGGIYRHFDSKEELAAECFRFSWAQTVRSRSGDVAQIPNAVDKLRYLVNRFVSASSSVPGGCPLMNTAIDADDGNLRLRDLAEKGLKDWKGRLAKIIKEGVERGEISNKANSQRLSNTIVALLEGALMISRIEKSSKALNDAKETLAVILNDIAS